MARRGRARSCTAARADASGSPRARCARGATEAQRHWRCHSSASLPPGAGSTTGTPPARLLGTSSTVAPPLPVVGLPAMAEISPAAPNSGRSAPYSARVSPRGAVETALPASGDEPLAGAAYQRDDPWAKWRGVNHPPAAPIRPFANPKRPFANPRPKVSATASSRPNRWNRDRAEIMGLPPPPNPPEEPDYLERDWS